MAKIVGFAYRRGIENDALVVLDEHGRLWQLHRDIFYPDREFWSPLDVPPVPDELPLKANVD